MPSHSGGGSSGSSTLNKFDATTAPGVGDDSGDGYSIGSRWIDTTADEAYVCLDATLGAAVWVKTTFNTAAEQAFTPAGGIAANNVQSAIEEVDSEKAADSAVVKLTGDQTVAGVKTFSSDPIIPDEAYDATAWNGSLEPATKNALRDKFESLGGGGAWELVEYLTGSGVSSITSAAVDLATDLEYLILLQLDTSSAAIQPCIEINGANTAYGYINSFAEFAASASGGQGGSNNASYWDLGSGKTYRAWFAQIHLQLLNSPTGGSAERAVASWKVSGIDDEASASRTLTLSGTGVRAGSTNITSIKAMSQGAQTGTWKMWILKPTTA